MLTPQPNYQFVFFHSPGEQRHFHALVLLQCPLNVYYLLSLLPDAFF